MVVAWQGGGKRDVSGAETVSMGGVYLYAAEPPSPGTFLQVLFDSPSGEVRARAVVRHTRAGRGMGVQFVHMDSDSRARLHRFVQQLKAEQPRQAIAAPSSWFASELPALDSGEIENHHQLFAVLSRIYSGRMTGKLQLVLGRMEKELFFNSGQLIFATSSDRHDSLGEMMLRAGYLTQREFEEASALVETGQRFGSAIAEMGLYSTEEVAGWVQKQLKQITASVLDYPACRYYFFGSLEGNVVPEIGIAVPLGKLLVEAVRKANDLPLEHLAEDDHLWVDLSPDPLLRYQSAELDDSERQLTEAISKAVSARDLLNNGGLPKAKAARALYNLLVLGIVVCVSPSAPAQSTQAAAMPQPEPQAQPSENQESLKQFEEEIRKLLEFAGKATYYELLGVNGQSTPSQIKQTFRRLASKFHPDHHMGRSEWVGLLQDLMGRLTKAYLTLTDDEKRARYDQELVEKGAFLLGQSKTQSEETVDECLFRAKQCLQAHNLRGSILWLRKCVRLAPDVAKHHAMLARSLAAVPQYRQEALKYFESAIELDPWNTSTYFQFAELYELMKLPWRAVPLYRKILEIDSEHIKANARLSELQTKEEPQGKKSLQFVSRLFQRESS